MEYCGADTLACVGINGSEAEGIVSFCKIHDSKESYGVNENGKGTIENCDLRDNAKGAWYIKSGCQVRRSGNKE